MPVRSHQEFSRCLNCLIIAAEREPRNLALQATFADINIAHHRSVCQWLGKPVRPEVSKCLHCLRFSWRFLFFKSQPMQRRRSGLDLLQEPVESTSPWRRKWDF